MERFKRTDIHIPINIAIIILLPIFKFPFRLLHQYNDIGLSIRPGKHDMTALIDGRCDINMTAVSI